MGGSLMGWAGLPAELPVKNRGHCQPFASPAVKGGLCRDSWGPGACQLA